MSELLGIVGIALTIVWFAWMGSLVRNAGRSVKIQRAMLEELQRLNALAAPKRPGEPAGGRFSGLAGE